MESRIMIEKKTMRQRNKITNLKHYFCLHLFSSANIRNCSPSGHHVTVTSQTAITNTATSLFWLLSPNVPQHGNDAATPTACG